MKKKQNNYMVIILEKIFKKKIYESWYHTCILFVSDNKYLLCFFDVC